MLPVKTLIRLGGCPGWSESLLGTQVILLVCRAMAYLSFSVWRSLQRANTRRSSGSFLWRLTSLQNLTSSSSSTLIFYHHFKDILTVFDIIIVCFILFFKRTLSFCFAQFCFSISKNKWIIWNICQIINTIARHVSSYNLSTQVFCQLMGLDSDWRRWKSNLKLKGGMINLLSFCCSAFHSKT